MRKLSNSEKGVLNPIWEGSIFGDFSETVQNGVWKMSRNAKERLKIESQVSDFPTWGNSDAQQT
jgi:hypothetical protein